MNIFVIDINPEIAATYLCDKHISKMLLESCQMLCSAFEIAPYKKTHYHHPCTVWTRTSKENYEWLIKHAEGISKEYTLRYNKTHACQRILDWVKENYDTIKFKEFNLTPFAQAMPIQYKRPDAVDAYRIFYKAEKRRFAKWDRGRPAPDWWVI